MGVQAQLWEAAEFIPKSGRRGSKEARSETKKRDDGQENRKDAKKMGDAKKPGDA